MSYRRMPDGRVIIDADIQIKTRIASGVDPKLVAAFSKVCEILEDVRRCFLLEALFPEDPEMKLLVVPTVETNDEGRQDAIIRHFQEMLRAFPGEARRTLIAFDTKLVEKYSGRHFFGRQ